MISAITYRRHHCNARHRDAHTFARCAIRRTRWIRGSGPFAVVSWCNRPTVSLWPDYASAARAHLELTGTGCGNGCRRTHSVLRFDLDHQHTN